MPKLLILILFLSTFFGVVGIFSITESKVAGFVLGNILGWWVVLLGTQPMVAVVAFIMAWAWVLSLPQQERRHRWLTMLEFWLPWRWVLLTTILVLITWK